MSLKLQGHHLPGIPDVDEVVGAARRQLAAGGRPLEPAHFPRVAFEPRGFVLLGEKGRESVLDVGP